MIDKLTMELKDTAENREALEKLKREAEKYPGVIYGDDSNGNVFPVAKIEKHPDCPDGWYESFMKKLCLGI